MTAGRLQPKVDIGLPLPLLGAPVTTGGELPFAAIDASVCIVSNRSINNLLVHIR